MKKITDDERFKFLALLGEREWNLFRHDWMVGKGLLIRQAVDAAIRAELREGGK